MKGDVMRTLRLSLIGTVIVALLASVSGVSIAQDDAAAEYAAVTGTMIVLREGAGPEVATSPDVPQESGTGWVFEVHLYSSDPRLSGDAVVGHNYYAFVPGPTGGRVWSVAGRLANDGGSWLLEGQGFAQPGEDWSSGNHYALRLTGEGGYEDFSAMLLTLPTGEGQWDLKGVLFPGSMPEYPALPE